MIQTYRLIHAKAARSRLRVPRVWSWHLGLKPQDMFLASYPRSGSTWLRFMLFQTLTGEDPGFKRIDQGIPEIQLHRGVAPLLPGGGRLIKTHEQYRREYTKAVFLVRDIRDVLVSCYVRSVEAGLAQLVSKGDFDSFLLSFLRGRALQQGSWQQHSRSWLESPLAKNGNLMVVRYEDLRRDSEQVIGQLLKFLGVTPDSRIIRKAIENNSLQQMRAKEDNAIKAGEQSALLGCHQSPGGEEGRFIRKGSIGGWRSELTDANVRLIGQYTGDVLATLGYEPGLVEEQRSESTSALSI
jgi:sulfotransferase family protein